MTIWNVVNKFIDTLYYKAWPDKPSSKDGPPPNPPEAVRINRLMLLQQTQQLLNNEINQQYAKLFWNRISDITLNRKFFLTQLTYVGKLTEVNHPHYGRDVYLFNVGHIPLIGDVYAVLIGDPAIHHFSTNPAGNIEKVFTYSEAIQHIYKLTGLRLVENLNLTPCYHGFFNFCRPCKEKC